MTRAHTHLSPHPRGLAVAIVLGPLSQPTLCGFSTDSGDAGTVYIAPCVCLCVCAYIRGYDGRVVECGGVRVRVFIEWNGCLRLCRVREEARGRVRASARVCIYVRKCMCLFVNVHMGMLLIT